MRVSTGKVRRRAHKKILSATKGYRMTKNRLYKVAHEAYMHAGQYSYNDRKKRLGQLKNLWIKRLNAAAQAHGLRYSEFMDKLKKANIVINRKILADLAVDSPEVFSQIVKSF
ncbi:MAG: 50S ribosomal protein L20 [candidate division WS6 bacterium GW2011_GWF2_39_15]|uniref:Large ribosomal subunit protein bL20 n=1 Tax=candidate division WS6 bacterium GW2011_GWF2_39_15 TaxID=1619100 RepID=A0A0G0N055_9BACT|nr:MAG: 50S ribosomal protein L20 [candidate division WS6 bacterium GW2011_GWF2_39_15]